MGRKSWYTIYTNSVKSKKEVKAALNFYSPLVSKEDLKNKNFDVDNFVTSGHNSRVKKGKR